MKKSLKPVQKLTEFWNRFKMKTKMKNLYLLFLPCLAAMAISCATVPPERKTATESRVSGVPVLPPETPGEVPEGAAETRQGRTSPPEKPAIAPLPEYIMGKGIISHKDMAAFLLDSNPEAETDFVENLTLIYTEEAAVEGVNHDTAFAQMCLETGFLSFGGDVRPEQNNFCGLGATGNGEPGLSFPDARTGARAHIQHLKAYATEEPLEQELVDPRFRYVRRASSPAIKGLAGTWAADRSYAEKINNILERLYTFAFLSEGGPEAP